MHPNDKACFKLLSFEDSSLQIVNFFDSNLIISPPYVIPDRGLVLEFERTVPSWCTHFELSAISPADEPSTEKDNQIDMRIRHKH